ncbi:hypothetical protein ATCC90586_009494 [Pythium insidiosum]|nr:hypothetical protein ATCC90586_009494 [Pythium insidiosum]
MALETEQAVSSPERSTLPLLSGLTPSAPPAALRSSKLKPPTQRALLLPLVGPERGSSRSPVKLPTLSKSSSNQDRQEGDAADGDGSCNGSGPDRELVQQQQQRSVVAEDKHRRYLRELEEQKRLAMEEHAREEARRQRLRHKLSQRILKEAARARESGNKAAEQEGAEEKDEPREEIAVDGGGDERGGATKTKPTKKKKKQKKPKKKGDAKKKGKEDEEEDEEERGAPEETVANTNGDVEEAEKALRQRRLLEKQRAWLEQLQAKKREMEAKEARERERERRRQAALKRAVLDAIHAKAEVVEEEEGVGEEKEVDAPPSPAPSVPDEEEDDGHQAQEERDESVAPTEEKSEPTAAGNAMAAIRQRQQQQQQQQQSSDRTEPPAKPAATNAVHKKQQEYLQRLAEQRRQRQREEEDARLEQERRRRVVQQQAQQRLQEAVQRSQAQAQAQAEAEASTDDEPRSKPVVVDVDAMVARLSRLKDRDASVVPEARDFASWKRRHGVRPEQKVFSMTGWYPVIREELEKRGWFFNADRESPFFDLKWSLKSDDLKGVKLAKHQYVNHFFANTALTTKVGLLHSLRGLAWHQSVDVHTVFPRAYDLNEPRDMDAFVLDFRYTFAEGVLKELVKAALAPAQRATLRVNEGVVDVLRRVVAKKLRSLARGLESAEPEDWALEESVDDASAAAGEDVVTDLEWEVLSKCAVDAVGSLRASLAYKPRGLEDDGGGAEDGAAELSAEDKRARRLEERRRAEAFAREKARLSALLQRVSPLSDDAVDELVRMLSTLARVSPQLFLNGGGPAGAEAARGLDLAQLAASRAVSRNVWIVKPAGMSRGRGIRVFNRLDALLEYADVANHKECQWVAQKYIENPLLICRRKFDIRQWVLVTSWDPLTVWFYADCYVRFSSQEYSTENLDDAFVHLTNNSIQKHSDSFHDVYATDDGSMQVEGNMWHSDELRQYLRRQRGGDDVFLARVQPRMQQLVVLSLQCVQDQVQHRENACELYGYDFMLDDALQPWLIEVNSSPACDYSTPTAQRYVETGLRGIVQVIVDHREFELRRRAGKVARDKEPEPDTGRWRRIFRGEFVGKPVSSFGADFQVRGLKVARARGKSKPAAKGVGPKPPADEATLHRGLAEEKGEEEQEEEEEEEEEENEVNQQEEGEEIRGHGGGETVAMPEEAAEEEEEEGNTAVDGGGDEQSVDSLL